MNMMNSSTFVEDLEYALKKLAKQLRDNATRISGAGLPASKSLASILETATASHVEFTPAEHVGQLVAVARFCDESGFVERMILPSCHAAGLNVEAEELVRLTTDIRSLRLYFLAPSEAAPRERQNG